MLEGECIGQPGLGVITRTLGGDGVAYAGALLERALGELAGTPPRTVELGRTGLGPVPRRDMARFVWRVGAEHARRRTDWWLFNHVGIARAQRLIPAALRTPYAVLLCGIEVWDPDLSRARKNTLRGAALRLAISTHTADRVSAVHPEIGEVVACPLALLPERAPEGVPDDSILARLGPKSVLIVGRMSKLERYKGHDQLIACWSRVLARVPEAQLVVAGKGDDLPRLRQRAMEAGVGDSVLFLGFVPDATLRALRQRAALFAMPSRGEGFGLVYLEAMRAGLPCVGSRMDAAADVITDGETGILVDPDDADELASGVCRILESPRLRDVYGRAGRRRYEDVFTFDRFQERLRPHLVRTFGTSKRRAL